MLSFFKPRRNIVYISEMKPAWNPIRSYSSAFIIDKEMPSGGTLNAPAFLQKSPPKSKCKPRILLPIQSERKRAQTKKSSLIIRSSTLLTLKQYHWKTENMEEKEKDFIQRISETILKIRRYINK